MVRGEDGRFQFFNIERRSLAGETITIDDIERVNTTTTTWLQDGALYERKAEMLADDREASAQAWDDAASAYDTANYLTRSLACATRANEVLPTQERFATAAYATVRATYDTEMPDDDKRKAIASVVDGLAQYAKGTRPEDTAESLRLGAFLHVRRAELAEDHQVDAASTASRWALPYCALQPDDAGAPRRRRRPTEPARAACRGVGPRSIRLRAERRGRVRARNCDRDDR